MSPNSPLLASEASGGYNSHDSSDATSSITDQDQQWTLKDMVTSPREKTGLSLILTGCALLFGATTLLVLTSPVPRLFIPHPALNSLALVCAAMAIASVQPSTPAPAAREQRLDVHKHVASLAVVLLIAGTTFMYYNKEAHNAEHNTTAHAHAGGLVVMWILAQATLGGIAVALGKKGLWLYKWHRISGYGFISLALITAFAGGMLSAWSQTRPAPLRIVAYGVGIPLIAAGLFLRAQPSKMGFTKSRARTQ